MLKRIIPVLVIAAILIVYNYTRPNVVSFTHESPGGSGTFYYVTSSAKDSKPYFLGDRIAPQTIEQDGDMYVVNYADRAPGESFAVQPSVGKTVRLKFDSVKKEFFQVYKNKFLDFSSIVPDGFTVSETGDSVKFTIPESLSEGTNLSKDTNVSVETATECKASTSSEGAAGNYYVEEVFVLRESPCLVAHYFIHSTQLLNYPEGTRVEFDKEKLLGLFDLIKNSVK